MRSSSELWGLSAASIALLLAYSAAQRFRRTADLGRDRRDGSPLRFVVVDNLAAHAHRALDDFGEYLVATS